MTVKKQIKRIIFLGLIIVFGTFIVVFSVLGSEFLPVQLSISEPAKKESFVIKPETSEAEIISGLYDKGFIRSKETLNYILDFTHWHNKIKAGGFEISKSMWPWQIVEVLIYYPSQRWVFIREGLRKEEIAETLRVSLGWSKEEKEEFLKEAKEGYMWPDTYLFDLKESGGKMAKRMINNFNEKFSNLALASLAANIQNDTVVILASLIQKEAANEAEMPVISGIIWNRLLNDYYLQIDATLQYALGRSGNWWPKITKADYKINSDYNTYTHKGHPPGPICNPGLAAIKAVIYPQDTDYFFYLHDSSGQIHYAKTFQEHLKNIQKYY